MSREYETFNCGKVMEPLFALIPVIILIEIGMLVFGLIGYCIFLYWRYHMSSNHALKTKSTEGEKDWELYKSTK